MSVNKAVSVYEFVNAISETLDLGAPALANHHKKTAYIAWRIATEIGLPHDEVQDVVLAAMLHDIGAFSLEDRIQALEFEADAHISQCAMLGARLLDEFEPLARAAALIRYHYAAYDSTQNIPLGSYIIHLSDRCAVLIDEEVEVLQQVPEIRQIIADHRDDYHPVVYAVFERLSEHEVFWLEAASAEISSSQIRRLSFTEEFFDYDTLASFARLISQLIDFRSHFTATHSSGVAAVATELTRISGFSDHQCQLILISGYLHDLGKIAVPTSLLEKPGLLTIDEFNTVKKHAYYTFSILNEIHGMKDIAIWAAYHHERENGTGYPFGISGSDLNRLSQIVACADIFTATSENRPYRQSMNETQIANLLSDIAASGGIEKDIISLAIGEFNQLNEVRATAQSAARQKYNDFYRD